ncbi:MAG: DUF2855 family protein [Parvibaculaceae bacterium]|nr:DUF2855 family protein [Parvibaculaceae bacterium]
MTITQMQVLKDKITETRFVETALPTEADLKDGEILFALDRFSLTANNVTYAAIGDRFSYWQYFPAEGGWGNVPVWGFANVVASKCPDVKVGERFYGYYPMTTHLVVKPGKITPNQFIDEMDHRLKLHTVYNQYIRTSNDAGYREDQEDLQALLRPLFMTSFLLDDYIADNEFFGADQIVISSASSKTAFGMAFLLKKNHGARCKIVGLTSPGNIEFVKALGCYDQVVTYDEVDQLDGQSKSFYVDFSGNSAQRKSVHDHFGEHLTYDCIVGSSHWDQSGGLTDLAGPQPIIFFAPDQASKRLKEWGGAGFQTRYAEAWAAFLDVAKTGLTINNLNGVEALKDAWLQIVEGKARPDQGMIFTLHK